MEMIRCPKCGKQISDTCTQCIYCGYELKKEQGIDDETEEYQLEMDPIRKGCIWSCVALVVFCLLAVFIPQDGAGFKSTKYYTASVTHSTVGKSSYKYDTTDTGLKESEYWCMGKGNTCKNKTYSPYDFYCS